jgi:hypothetical protein
MTAFDTTPDNDSPIGGSHRLAACLCLLGFFMLIVLSQPFLNSLGLLSSNKLGGNPLEKVHPGSMIIILSLYVCFQPVRHTGASVVRRADPSPEALTS